MEQKRKQVAWRDESPRRQKKRIARRRRIMIAYIVRGIVVVILAVMVLLMICGCLYIKDFFQGDKDTSRKAESDRGAVSHIGEETEPIRENKEDTRYKIILDAGHGGADGGTEKQAAVEKDINLEIVLEMKELLENKNIRVALTRDRDVFMSLEDRVQAAEEEGADLFLSVHCNYYEKDSSISGLCRCYTLMTFTPLYPIYPTQFDIRQTGFDKIPLLLCEIRHKMISAEFFIFIDIFPAKTYNNIRDGKPSSGEFLPDSGKLYIQESSCQIVENFINQEIPCQTVGNFKIKG